MEKCPNCQTTTSGAKANDYWGLITSYESLAKRSGSVRDLVKAAENRLAKIATNVTSEDENMLAYKEHETHLFAACRLLDEAKDILIKRKKKSGVSWVQLNTAR